MIPRANLLAWGRIVPWSSQNQIEQDLIICRTLVELFADPFLRSELRFRGGTALNKLHFPTPLRYSEDIDLVRTTRGPIKPLIDRLRKVLEPWLGNPGYESSPVAPKLRFRVPGEDGSTIRLKIEINTWEIEAFDPTVEIPFKVENPWFTGKANITTFSREEMMATKLRALLQRDKGRDIFDLAHALEVFPELNLKRTIECFRNYLEISKKEIPRAEAEQRMFQKWSSKTFITDLKPLLAPGISSKLDDAAAKRAFESVFHAYVLKIPGDEWARTRELKEKFGLSV